MYTDLFRRPTLRISMQYFADPEGGEGADGGTDTGAEIAADQKPTLKELLASNKAYQSEFDKMSSKALETAKEKWDADAKAQADEAAKLAKKLI